MNHGYTGQQISANQLIFHGFGRAFKYDSKSPAKSYSTSQWRKVPHQPRGLSTTPYLFPYPPKLEGHGKNPICKVEGEDSVSGISS